MVFEKVQAIICAQFDLSKDAVKPDSVIMEDFDADSLDLIDLAMSIEDEFEMEVPDEELENFRTVDDIVKYIEEH
ncbi:Acyl carrier protein [bioreactor metagenome]|uniref:Acyl carrier protein n=1 Tax=bioreactor metagenome TaxID=1076179 RepID=A0A645FBC5_9ZZZZ